MKEVKIEEFTVIGLSIRTNNALEGTASGKIPALWEQFYGAKPGLSETAYGVYFDYDSDHEGDFSVTAGIKAEVVGKSGITIRSGSYLAFPAEGEMPAAIVNTWKAIWDYFTKNKQYKRLYETDFEQYNGPTSAVIYIGVASS